MRNPKKLNMINTTRKETWKWNKLNINIKSTTSRNSCRSYLVKARNHRKNTHFSNGSMLWNLNWPPSSYNKEFQMESTNIIKEQNKN